jgi:TRAP-type C4-dicarboxylate transport system permease small subunit
MLASVASLLFLACFTYAGICFCKEQSDDISQTLGIPYAIPMAAIPLSGFVMFFVLLNRVWASRFGAKC